MKHIFTIHSHITYLAALGAIALEKIDTNNVIFICNSGYKPLLPNGFKGQTNKALDYSASERNLIKKLRPFSYSLNANKYIDNLTDGEKYIAYIDLMSSFNKYLAFHKKCQNFHIIEEGIVNYGEYYDLNLLTADIRSFTWSWTGLKSIKELLKAVFRLYRGRSMKMERLPIHPNIYANFPGVKAYCFSSLAFPLITSKNRKILDIVNLPNLEQNMGSFPEGTWFWIGDTLAKSYDISMKDFRAAGNALMSSLGNSVKGSDIYLKFRGPESNDEKAETISFLESKGFVVKCLDKEVIMELVFANGINFNVCGIASSLLIYAKNFRHKTHSILPFIPNDYGVSIYRSYPTLYKNVYANE